MQDRTHILVVDDDDNERLLLKTLIKKMQGNFEVLAVSNGYEAIKATRQTPFKLLLTDLQMAQMDGVTLTKAFAALCPQAVVIWITAYGCHIYRDKQADLPIFCCLDKPVEIDVIRHVITEALAAPPGDG